MSFGANDRSQSDCSRFAGLFYAECVEMLIAGQDTLHSEESEPWSQAAISMLRRGLIIGATKTRRKTEFSRLSSTLDYVRAAAVALYSSIEIPCKGKLALDFCTVEPTAIALNLEAAAAEVQRSGNFAFAVDVYCGAERAHERCSYNVGRDRCVRATASTFVAWADASKNSATHEAHRLQQGIAMLHRIKGTSADRQSLQNRLVNLQLHIRGKGELSGYTGSGASD